MSDPLAPCPELFALSEAAHGISVRLAARADARVPAGAARDTFALAAETWPVLRSYPAYAPMVAAFARCAELGSEAGRLGTAAGQIEARLAALHPPLREGIDALILPLSGPLGVAASLSAGGDYFAGAFARLFDAWREADARTDGAHKAEVEAVIAAIEAPLATAKSAIAALVGRTEEARAALTQCRRAVDGLSALTAEAEALTSRLKALSVGLRPGRGAIRRASGMIGPATFRMGIDPDTIDDARKRALLKTLDGVIELLAASIDLPDATAGLVEAAGDLPAAARAAGTLAGRLDTAAESFDAAMGRLHASAAALAAAQADWDAATDALAAPDLVARQEKLAEALGLKPA
ncbi:MAG: hypothetical protein OEM24_01770 [Paracoccaceae bacterium]|nr:hypothetical protein [Paracoccaceae bacterium]